MTEIILTRAEADLIRQWYNAVQDLNPGYLEAQDGALIDRVRTFLGSKYDASSHKLSRRGLNRAEYERATNGAMIPDDAIKQPLRWMVRLPHGDKQDV